jgi:hypothetical protein
MKKLISFQTVTKILIFLIFGQVQEVSFLYGQKRINNDSSYSQQNFPFLRTGDFLSRDVSGTIAGSTHFLPIYLTNGLERWTSPGTFLMIDGIPFNSFPFNFNSVDLLPIDLIQIENIEIENLPSVGPFHSSSMGSVNITLKPIPDSFQVSIRSFTGSETGDPLFHVFTRPGITVVNKNKVVPTGFFSISGKSSKLSYRISSGYAGYYSTGSINDLTINSVNSYHFKKQNKQVLACAELGFDIDAQRKLRIFSSFISYYGWDLTPFLSSYVHTESYLHTIRISISELFKGFDLILLKNSSIGDINEGTGILPARFSIDQYSLLPVWSPKISNDLSLAFSSDINYHIAKNNNREVGSSTQDFFPSTIKEWSYGFTTNIRYLLQEHLESKINLRYENSYCEDKELSLDVRLTKRFNKKDKISLNTSSVARLPNLTEIYGNFYTFRNTSSDVSDTFNIKGSKDLIYERNNSVGISFEHSETTFSLSTEVYIQKIQNPILQTTLKSVRTEFPGDILRDVEYRNGKDKNLAGLNISINKPLDFLILDCSYSYTDNSKARYTPKHKFLLSGSILLPFNAALKVEWLYRGEAFWEEYRVERNNDFLSGIGFNAVVPEINRFNTSFGLHINSLYFLRDIDFTMLIENIFNNAVQYHPLGNKINRAFIFSLSLKI